MKNNISPEDKLLKLIKGEGKEKPKITTVSSPLAPSAKYSIYPIIRRYLTPAYIHRLIRLFVAISCVYLITSFIYPWWGLKKIKLPKITQNMTQELKIEPKEEQRPLEFYLEAIKNRQIFSSSSISDTYLQTAPASATSLDLIKYIKLVGIVSGENPQAIIEDEKLHRTYYLNKGQFMGEFQIEDIQEGKIILNYKGQRYELYL